MMVKLTGLVEAPADASDFIDFATRDLEVDHATTDAQTHPRLRAELQAHLRYYKAFGRFVDARLATARVGWFAGIMRRTEPLENRAVLVLIRHRAGGATEHDVIDAFRDLRRAFIAIISEEDRT